MTTAYGLPLPFGQARVTEVQAVARAPRVETANAAAHAAANAAANAANAAANAVADAADAAGNTDGVTTNTGVDAAE